MQSVEKGSWRRRHNGSDGGSETQPYERLLSELMGLLNPLRRGSFERRLNGAIAVIPFEEALYGILLSLQTPVGQFMA